MAQSVGFWFLALVSVVSALMVVMNRNPVRCALYLIVNFSCLAIFYLMLHAEVLAALQILVYAGAIMVLFLFVIMLLNLGGEQVQHDPLVGQRPLALALGAAMLVGLTAAFSNWGGSTPAAGAPTAVGTNTNFDQVSEIGRQLF